MIIRKEGITIYDAKISISLENPRKLLKCYAIRLAVLILIQVFLHIS